MGSSIVEETVESGNDGGNEYQVSALEILRALQADRRDSGRDFGTQLGTALRSVHERVPEEKDDANVVAPELMPIHENL
jgi:hypothetical protein